MICYPFCFALYHCRSAYVLLSQVHSLAIIRYAMLRVILTKGVLLWCADVQAVVLGRERPVEGGQQLQARQHWPGAFLVVQHCVHQASCPVMLESHFCHAYRCLRFVCLRGYAVGSNKLQLKCSAISSCVVPNDMICFTRGSRKS